MRKHWLISLLASILVAAGTTPSAIEQLKQLQAQADAARKAGDTPGRLAAIAALTKLLNHSPEILKAEAKAYAAAGDTERALAALEWFAAMGQSDAGLANSDTFATLHSSPRFRAVVEKMKANDLVVEKAETAFVLKDESLLAEDMDYDTASRSFLLTSVMEKKIVRVDSKGQATDFARSPSGWPMLAIKIDAARKRVWATEAALEGEGFSPKNDWGKSAVLCFDLQTGKLLQRVEAPNTALGDMVLTAMGDPIVSDGEGGGVYEMVNGKLALLNAQDFISPQTPALSPDPNQVFVPDYARGVGILDLTTRQVAWLKGAHFALTGIDGLYFNHGALIATQNGTSPERVVRFTLDESLREVAAEEVIERATQTLGDPTHGVVVGNSFYYIANSGWNYVDERGVLKSGVKRMPPRIMRFKLR